ncbi:MAG: sulfotransferase [Sodalinema sp.]|uniref:sulfotransferase family protein n=1 Tax=Sodalinema sp. TaxID=3080550 RepID=UPI00396F2940
MKKLKNWPSLKTLFKKPRSPSSDPPASHQDALENALKSAATYQATNQLEAAAQDYLNILRDYPNKSWWYNRSLWEVLEKTNRLQTAIAILAQSNQQSSSVQPAIALNLAEALTRQGNEQAAIRHYQSVSYAKFSKSYQHLVKTAWTETSLSPKFIIIGAAKSGTSALYSYLASHPNVLPAVVKEINFWSHRFQYGLPWYQSHFPAISQEIAKQQGLITGEASPSYFAHPEAPQRIKQAYPDIRLIVSLRNPVDRTISHYYDRVRRGQEMRPLDVAIYESLAGNPSQSTSVEFVPDYLRESCYGANLTAWYSHFEPEQIYVLKSEELLNQPAATSQSVFEYLGLPRHELREYRKYNVGNYQSSMSRIDDDSDAKLKTALQDYFKEDMEQLTDITGKVLNWWS